MFLRGGMLLPLPISSISDCPMKKDNEEAQNFPSAI